MASEIDSGFEVNQHVPVLPVGPALDAHIAQGISQNHYTNTKNFVQAKPQVGGKKSRKSRRKSRHKSRRKSRRN